MIVQNLVGIWATEVDLTGSSRNTKEHVRRRGRKMWREPLSLNENQWCSAKLGWASFFKQLYWDNILSLNQLEVYSSMVFSIFGTFYNHHLSLILKKEVSINKCIKLHFCYVFK